jgi:hypothetical protein
VDLIVYKKPMLMSHQKILCPIINNTWYTTIIIGMVNQRGEIYHFIMLTCLNDAPADMARAHGMPSQLRDHFDPKWNLEGLKWPI